MNGVAMPSVSPGSSQREARVMWTPQVMVPSGGAAAEPGTPRAGMSATTARKVRDAIDRMASSQGLSRASFSHGPLERTRGLRRASWGWSITCAVPSLPRRWRIVAALFTVTFGISMPLAAYGVFLPIIAETFGWSRGAIAAALSVNLVLGGVTGFFVGRLADQHGPRVMLLVTIALAGTGFGLISTVSMLWQLYLLVGLVAGAGMSSFYLLSASTVAHWFPDRRGLAIALVLIGFNVGYMAAGPLAAWLIAHLGWRRAYAVIGFGCAALAMLAASTVRLPRPAERPSPARPGHAGGAPALGGVTLAHALGDLRFWCLNGSWLLLGATIF